MLLCCAAFIYTRLLCSVSELSLSLTLRLYNLVVSLNFNGKCYNVSHRTCCADTINFCKARQSACGSWINSSLVRPRQPSSASSSANSSAIWRKLLKASRVRRGRRIIHKRGRRIDRFLINPSMSLAAAATTAVGRRTHNNGVTKARNGREDDVVVKRSLINLLIHRYRRRSRLRRGGRPATIQRR